MIRTEQKKWTAESAWKEIGKGNLTEKPQLVLVFGGSALVSTALHFEEVKNLYPNAHILSCSTAGEIIDVEISDNTIVTTAIHFDDTKVELRQIDIKDAEESFKVGEELALALPAKGLTHVMVFSDGLKVNGTALVQGLGSKLPKPVSVTGGLVGDGGDFKHTYVGLDAPASEGKVVAVGFYGSKLRVGYGSLGGWDGFGPERIITKSKGNILYELDKQPALALYKNYLGEKAKDLPCSGLLFPLCLQIKEPNGEELEVVRTILAVDEASNSITFAGDVPEGTSVQLMKANFERLVDGASGAAKIGLTSLKEGKPELTILISCIGRKLVLKERIEEEVEAIRSVVGEQATITGFYSYGELCPGVSTEKQCQLHNQTMTITLFRED